MGLESNQRQTDLCLFRLLLAYGSIRLTYFSVALPTELPILESGQKGENARFVFQTQCVLHTAVSAAVCRNRKHFYYFILRIAVWVCRIRRIFLQILF